MSPEVTAAWIAAGVGVLTVAATAVTQYFSRRATGRDTDRLFAEQRGQQAQAFAEQRGQQAQAFAEQREQLDKTLAEQRTRTLNERFATAADRLGSDKPPTVRLAGVYAMAGLADDWPENRQTCVDVLCGYLRMPYEPHPGDEAPAKKQLDFEASREVRHTVIRVITAHLQADVAQARSWQGLDFDFTGAVFDGADFIRAQFSGGKVRFSGSEFSGGITSFHGAQFSGGEVRFNGARFSGGTVDFNSAQFCGGTVYFRSAQFSGGRVTFGSARFSGGTVAFTIANFDGGTVDFHAAEFPGGTVDFLGALFFRSAPVFRGAVFSGGTVDFSRVATWSFPPTFPWTGEPPKGVKLPEKEIHP
jgi:hypothetical protein